MSPARGATACSRAGVSPALLAPDPAGLAAVTVVLATGSDGGRAGAHRDLQGAAAATLAGTDPVALATAADDGSLLQGRRGSVATSGVAARLELPGGLRPQTAGDVVRWLAAVPSTDPVRRPGSGPLAVAALPFAPGAPASLVVPVVTVVRTAGGDAWATVVAPAPLSTAAALETLSAALRAAGARQVPASADRAPRAAGPHPVSVRLWPDGPGFEAAVEQALAAVAEGRISKVVLARQVEADFRHPVDEAAVLRRLRRLEPSCAVFAHRGDGRAFVGASPELLVRRRHDRVVSHPLAGTAPLRPSAEAAATLLRSAKERAEHGAAAAAVAERLAPWCAELQVPDHPALVPLSSVVHLGTRMVGRLRPLTPPSGVPAPPGPADGGRWAEDPGTFPDALTLAAALHPTPAVAGVPTDEALAVIAELEPHGRDRYAGPVGWVDARGDGELVVAIRSATIEGSHAVAYAGAGIVAGSDPHRELQETTLKLRTALGALGLPSDIPVTAAAG